MKPTRRTLVGLLAAAGFGVPSLVRAKNYKESDQYKRLSVCGGGAGATVSPFGIDTDRPCFQWTLSAGGERRNVLQQSCRLLVASTKQILLRGQGDVWDSGRIETAEMHVRPAFALPLKSLQTFWWSVTVWHNDEKTAVDSAPNAFVTGLIDPADWHAQWISDRVDPPWQNLPPTALGKHPFVQPQPLPIFRKEIVVSGALRQAVVAVSGLGQYELRVNGMLATEDVLNPGWTNYRKTTLYNIIDVTKRLAPGRNVLAVMLGNGLYDAENYEKRYAKFLGSFGPPKMLLQLKLSYADGREETIVSDGSWRSAPGPIVLSNAYNEDFDARREPAGWDKPGFSAADWAPVQVVAGPGGTLRAQEIPSVARDRSYAPVKVSTPKPGVTVYDLGQNFAGWPEIAVRGAAGRTVTLIPGESLFDDGTVRQFGAVPVARMSTQYRYTLRGAGVEHWHPRFSYFGFRYVQVEGAAPAGQAKEGEPELLALKGCFLHAKLKPVGRFDCSEPLFARIHALIKMALLSNCYSVLTDCPHREKLGWLEQTYLNADTVFCNLDAAATYAKLQRDIAEAQDAKGMVPGIAPEYVAFVKADGSNEIWRDSPEWGAACVFSLLAAYKYGGDVKILADGYACMQAYVAYLETRRVDGVLGYGMGDWYDVGPNPPGPAQLTSLALTGTATFYGLLRGVARVATLLGKSADAVGYAARAAEVGRLFQAKFFHPETNNYDTGSQTANAMALALGLTPPENRAAVLANLIADIRRHDNHTTAGDIGYHYVVQALMEADRGDVLVDMLSRTDPPSYGDQLAHGATTLTEAWDANPMNSQNHFMLGHIETWFYRGLGGVDLDMGAPVAERVRIAPQTVKGIAGAAVSYDSAAGRIACLWKRRNGVLQVVAEVPAGVGGTVVLPTSDPTRIREGGKPLAAVGLSGSFANGKTCVRVGSGRYRFEMPDD